MPDTVKKWHIPHLDFLGQFLFVFLPFLAIFTAATVAHYLTTHNTAQVNLETKEILNIGLARSAVINDLAGVITDLMFLSDYVGQQGFGDYGQAENSSIGELFKTFAGQKRLYDQIRLLDVTGHELVRVNYQSGSPLMEHKENLQNKSERYYFIEAMQLGPDEIYISPLDLNMEHGAIEQPHKPVMRFAISIFSPDGVRRGILVLNYLGERLLNHFRRAGSNAAESIYLLNSDGYWLSSPRTEDAWGFLLPHGRNFSKLDSEAWMRISKTVAGQFRRGEMLYTYETITPRSVADQTTHQEQGVVTAKSEDYKMKVVARVQEPMGLDSLLGFFHQHLPLYSTVFVVLIGGSILLSRANLKHRQAELQGAYERRFRRTLENIELAAVLINKSGQLEFCNDYFLQLSGWHRDQALGKDWLAEFITEQQRPEFEASFNDLRNHGQFPRNLEAELVTQEGKRRLIAWHNTLAQDVDGEITGITCLGEDISEQRLAEEQVRKLSRAVEQSPSIVMLTNRHGRIEYVNPKFVEVTGYTREEVVNKNPRFLKSGEMPSTEYERLWRKVKAGGVWRGEFHNRRKNGELYWESASISGLRGPEGEITHFVAVKEDITARKHLESEIEDRKQELARSESLAAMGRMASMIAHDLRNPLSSVKMGVQIMGKQGDEQSQQLSSIALEQIRHMETILRDMLAYARPEAVKTEWVNIEKLIDLSIRSVQRLIEESRVTLSTRYQQGLPTVPADPDKLRQVFSNLIVNAVQAVSGNAAGERELFCSTMLHLGDEGTGIRIEICDNGEGLQENEVGKLFEPFFTTRAKGTGLGLAICRQILQQHGGSIKLEPREGRGTCALVILPTTPRKGLNGKPTQDPPQQ